MCGGRGYGGESSAYIIDEVGPYTGEGGLCLLLWSAPKLRSGGLGVRQLSVLLCCCRVVMSIPRLASGFVFSLLCRPDFCRADSLLLDTEVKVHHAQILVSVYITTLPLLVIVSEQKYQCDSMPGYQATPVDATKDGFSCPHCKLILREAVQTDEGVRLCHSCFKEIAQ